MHGLYTVMHEPKVSTYNTGIKSIVFHNFYAEC